MLAAETRGKEREGLQEVAFAQPGGIDIASCRRDQEKLVASIQDRFGLSLVGILTRRCRCPPRVVERGEQRASAGGNPD